MKPSSLKDREQLNVLLAKMKPGLVTTVMNRVTEKLVPSKTLATDLNGLPLHLVSKLEIARTKALQSNQSAFLNQTKQDIIDTVFFLSHLYAFSSTTHNRILKKNIEQALTRLLVKYPLDIITILQLSDAQKKLELQEKLGLSVETMALFISYLTPEAIYDAKNDDNLVINFYLNFKAQVENFKKEDRGELSPEHMISLITQINYLTQILHRLPDNENYKLAKDKLNSLINSCCKVVPELAKQLSIVVPDLSFNLDYWTGAAGAEKKYAQPDILSHYKEEINQLNTDYVQLVNDTVKALINTGTDYHTSLKNINNQVKRYQSTLENIKKSTNWTHIYKPHFDKFDILLSKLSPIIKSCQAEYSKLIERDNELKTNYVIEINKINNFEKYFLELSSEEKATIRNYKNELKNKYTQSLKIIEARKQVLQSNINDIQKAIPTPEIFKQTVIDTIEAEMSRLLEKDGEKDQFFDKIGGDIFNSRAELLKELEQLATQSVPTKINQHVDKLALDQRVKAINRAISGLRGTGLDTKFKDKTQKLISKMENNNKQLSDVLQRMDKIADKIQHSKEQPIPVGSPLANIKVIELAALKKLASPDSPPRREIESSQNLSQLDEQPAYYDKATALIHARNDEVAQLQAQYKSLKQQYDGLKNKNKTLFDQLATVENDLNDDVSSIDLLNKQSRELRKTAVSETNSIDSLFSHLNSAKNEAKLALSGLSTQKNILIDGIKQDKSKIIDENGNSVSDLPNDMEQDAINSFNFLENIAEKLVGNQKKRAEKCVELEQRLQQSIEQKQTTRVSALNKIPETFQQYCIENKDKNYAQCLASYDNSLKEMEQEFNQAKVSQRKENREKAVSRLKDFYNDNALIAKNAIDEVARLNDKKNHVVATLQKQSADLDKTVKATVGGTAGGAIIGALTGAVTGFVIAGGPIGAVIGLVTGFALGLGIGGGAGFIAGSKLPIKMASSSDKQPIVNSNANSNDNKITQDELTVDNFDEYILGKDSEFKSNNTTIGKQKVSGISGTVFNHKAPAPSTNISSPDTHNAPKKNTFKS